MSSSLTRIWLPHVDSGVLPPARLKAGIGVHGETQDSQCAPHHHPACTQWLLIMDFWAQIL